MARITNEGEIKFLGVAEMYNIFKTLEILNQRKTNLLSAYFKESDNYRNFLSLINTWNSNVELISKKHFEIQNRRSGAISEIRELIKIIEAEKKEIEEAEAENLIRQYEDYKIEKYYCEGLEKVNAVYEHSEEVPF